MDAPTPFERAAGDIDRALVIRNLRKEYRPGHPVLKDVSLTVEGRGMTAIIGPSGTGKSTLVRCINRLVDPTSGEIHFRGHDMARLGGRELRTARRRMGMVFQEYNLVERLSVIENVLCGGSATWRYGVRGCASFPLVTWIAPFTFSTPSASVTSPPNARTSFPAANDSASALRAR
jgi:ABC-type branched-subunit amino acid transport system ATPase component